MNPGQPQRAHWTLLVVWSGGELFQVQGYDVPDGINPVWDYGRSGSPSMHRQGYFVQIATKTADPLFEMRRGTHSKIDDSVPISHAWDGAVD